MPHLTKLNLKLEMAVCVALIFIVIAGTSAWYAISGMEEQERLLVANQLNTLAHALADALDSKIYLARSSLQAAARTLPVDTPPDPRRLQSFLNERVTLHSLFTRGLSLYTSDGTLLATSPRGEVISEEASAEAVVRTAASGQSQISPPFTDGNSRHEPIVTVTAPISGPDGTVRLILAGNLDLLGSTIMGNLKEMEIGKSGYLFLSTANRILLYHPDPSRIMGIAANPGEFPLYDEALRGADAKGETRDAQGLSVASSFWRLQTGGWVLAVNLPVAEAYAGMYTIRRHLIWGFGGGSLAMLLLTWVVMRHLTRPLTDVTEQVRGMQGGELRPVVCSSRNEIGTLAAAFNNLVSRLNHQQESLQELMRRQQAIIDNVPDMAWLKDRQGRFITVNGQFTVISGWQNVDVTGKTDSDVWPPETALTYQREDEEVLTTGKRRYSEEKVIDRNGKTYFMEVIRTPIFGTRSEVIGIIGIAHDITARKQEELELRYASTHDRLTGLYNRALFDQELERLSRSRKYPISILMADVNDLKVVNDSRGHQAGDRLLAVAAKALLGAFRAEDVVARIGGDEFAVLLPETDEESAREAVKRVRDQLLSANRAESEFQVNIAFGIATAYKSDELLQAMQLSDERMYANKAEQKREAATRSATLLDYS